MPAQPTAEIDSLVESERLNWVVRGRLANVALEQAGHDRQRATALLQRAIAYLEMPDALPSDS
ncbi:hypothetical protein [Novosphingobium kunmingense]|uniref:hypothetical protein n=1 Tax=Novosphingobium kunmingense TaxID=1211806 RepID=UPI000C2B7489|nr:hypothetical protein [Novosphingobium kunmingense]